MLYTRLWVQSTWIRSHSAPSTRHEADRWFTSRARLSVQPLPSLNCSALWFSVGLHPNRNMRAVLSHTRIHKSTYWTAIQQAFAPDHHVRSFQLSVESATRSIRYDISAQEIMRATTRWIWSLGPHYPSNFHPNARQRPQEQLRSSTSMI